MRNAENDDKKESKAIDSAHTESITEESVHHADPASCTKPAPVLDKCRFVSQVSAPSKNSFIVQGKYFEYLTLDADHHAALMKQVEPFALRHTHLDESWGYEKWDEYDIPLANVRSLRDSVVSIAPNGHYTAYNGDFLVVDGKFVGIIMQRIKDSFNYTVNEHGEKFIVLDNNWSRLAILYTDGTKDGDAGHSNGNPNGYTANYLTLIKLSAQ